MVGGGGTPEWAVALLAGGFALLGGFVTFLLTRWNESTQFKRENQLRDDSEVAERGAELITAGNQMRDIAVLGLRRSVTEFTSLLATRATPAMDAFILASNKFRMVHPRSMDDLVKRYVATTAVLFLPLFAKPGQEHAVAEQSNVSNELLDALRVLRGREALNIEKRSESGLVDSADRLSAILRDELDNDAAASSAPETPTATNGHGENNQKSAPEGA